MSPKALDPETPDPETPERVEDGISAFMHASAQMLALQLHPAWLPGVRANLEVSFRLAQLVAAFPLDEDTEPAPVFEA